MSTSKKHKVRVREVKSRPDPDVPPFNNCFPQIKTLPHDHCSLFDANYDPSPRNPIGVSYPMKQAMDRAHSLGPVILCAEAPSDSEPSTFNEYPIKDRCRKKRSSTSSKSSVEKLSSSLTAPKGTSSSNFELIKEQIKDDLRAALAQNDGSLSWPHEKDSSESGESPMKQPDFYKRLLLENERISSQANDIKEDQSGFLLHKRSSNNQLGNFNFNSKRKSLAIVFNNIGEKLGLSHHSEEADENEGISDNPYRRRMTLASPGAINLLQWREVDAATERKTSDQTESRLVRKLSSAIPLLKRASINAGSEQDSSAAQMMNGGVPRGSVFEPTFQPTRGSGHHYNDNSFLVDLLCCTCCRSSDDEEYANLIENHRLARVITTVAVVVITVAILLYIIRSATEQGKSSK